jgi:hypothetical protein
MCERDKGYEKMGRKMTIGRANETNRKGIREKGGKEIKA